MEQKYVKTYEECRKDIYEPNRCILVETQHLILIRDDEPRCSIDMKFVQDVAQAHANEEKQCLEQLSRNAWRSFEE